MKAGDFVTFDTGHAQQRRYLGNGQGEWYQLPRGNGVMGRVDRVESTMLFVDCGKLGELRVPMAFVSSHAPQGVLF